MVCCHPGEHNYLNDMANILTHAMRPYVLSGRVRLLFALFDHQAQ